MFHHSDYKPATEAQKKCLRELGISYHESITAADANRLIQANRDRWEQLPATPEQEMYLRARYLFKKGHRRGEASRLIELLVAKYPNLNHAAPIDFPELRPYHDEAFRSWLPPKQVQEEKKPLKQDGVVDSADRKPSALDMPGQPAKPRSVPIRPRPNSLHSRRGWK